MDIEAALKSIRALHNSITTKTSDVVLTYKGNEYGVSKPYHIRVGDRETSSETVDGALTDIKVSLKKELSEKIRSTESEINRLRIAFGNEGN